MQRLTQALQGDVLQQVYQPIVACRNGQIVSVEALARWRNDIYGNVSLGEFIPLTEADTDMRRTLTR
jgi:sensor c-di-GMP phosphodiesterase-like protein